MSEKEVLVVASKVKKYIKKTGGLMTSATAIERFSDRLREICDKAIENAKNSKRKTVMDKDIR